MKTKLAVWYMEKAWLNMGSFRNIPALHKLFSVAYGIRKSEYMAKVLAVPVRMSDYQRERASDVRLMLNLNRGISC